MYIFETTCAVQIRAQAGGTLGSGDLIEIDAAIIARRRRAGAQR